MPPWVNACGGDFLFSMRFGVVGSVMRSRAFCGAFAVLGIQIHSCKTNALKTLYNGSVSDCSILKRLVCAL